MVVLTVRELQRLAQEHAEVEIIEDERRAEENYADYTAEYWPSESDESGEDEGDDDGDTDMRLYDSTGA